jgi:DNA-binding Lrp family transcriptional regulator
MFYLCRETKFIFFSYRLVLKILSEEQENKNISIKEINKVNILNLVKSLKSISRVAISKKLNISRPNVTEYVRKLIGEGLLKESGKSRSTSAGGKKAVLLSLNEKAGYIVAVMIGARTLKITLTDQSSSIIQLRKVATEEQKGPKSVIDKLVANIDSLIRDSKIAKEKFIGIGVGATGLVDSEKGTVLFSPNLRDWSDIYLRDKLEEKTGLMTFINNECRLQAIAEKKFGLAKQVSDFVCVETGIGIGTGVFVNDKLLVGRNGIVSEVGYIITNI